MTGAGKTRTVIALSDLLMRANWAKRVLFLADRVASCARRSTLSSVTCHHRHRKSGDEKDAQGRVYVSTYPTMMGLIDETAEGNVGSASGTSIWL